MRELIRAGWLAAGLGLLVGLGCGGPGSTGVPATSEADPGLNSTLNSTASATPTDSPATPPEPSSPSTSATNNRGEETRPGLFTARQFTSPTYAWRTLPTAVTAPMPETPSVPSSVPEPAPVPPKPVEPKPAVPPGEPEKPKEPEKPFEWPKDVNGKNLQEWIEELRNPDPSLREVAVRVLPAFGPEARKAASRKVMTMIADDPDPGVRMAAMTTAGLLGHESKDDIRPMVVALRNAIGKTVNGSAIRLFATRALATYGHEAADAIPVLSKIYIDPWWETRQAVAQALGIIGSPQYDDPPAKDPRTGQPVPKRPANDTAQKVLLQMLQKDDCAAVRLEAVMALISMGPPYVSNPSEYLAQIQPTLTVIESRLNPKKTERGETDKTVQIWLYVLKVMLDDRAFQESLPKIAGYLQTPSPLVRAQALTALATLGKRAAVQAVLTQVRDALYYEEEILVAAAIDCLMAMGTDAAGLIPELEKLKERTSNKRLKEIADEGLEVLNGKKKYEDILKARQKAAEEAMKKAALPPEKDHANPPEPEKANK
jgi:HEAT repeat protein